MKTTKLIKTGDHKKSLLVYRLLVYSLSLALLLPGALTGAEIPSIKDVVEGKASLPTIEDLTGGKVKIGDLIDKNNVDLVKEYLTAAMYENVKRGMVLRMGTQLPPEQLYPKAFREATERNRGKAVMNKNGAIYYEKIGTPWPGGLPFPWAKDGLEAMGNYQYGRVWDSYTHRPVHMWYINSKGEVYKSVGQEHMYVRCSGRTIEPPLGHIPGYENILIKRITVATSPLEIKGLGQFTVRYYDSAKDYDTGFAYLPAFKRTIRTSATTWQDNVAGSDVTYGDGDGFQDPYSDWDLKFIGKKYLLVTETSTTSAYDEKGKPRKPIYDEKKKPADGIQFDVGKKFPRIGWVIMPVDVVDATPKIKHIYGKRVVYIPIWPYIFTGGGIAATDIYDRQMKLWKGLFHIYTRLEYLNGDPQKPVTPYTACWYFDLQADHTTQMWMPCARINAGFGAEDISLTTLLKKGR